MYTFNIWLLYASSPFSVRNRRSLRLRTARKNTKLLLPRVCRWMLSQRHGHYHVNVTNFIISMLQVIASDCHGVYLNATNTMFATSRTLSLKCHKHYVRNITNSIIEMSQTLCSQHHELYHWNVTNCIIYVTNFILYIEKCEQTHYRKMEKTRGCCCLASAGKRPSECHKHYAGKRPSECHKHYFRNVTNSTVFTSPALWNATNSALTNTMSRTLSFWCHKL